LFTIRFMKSAASQIDGVISMGIYMGIYISMASTATITQFIHTIPLSTGLE